MKDKKVETKLEEALDELRSVPPRDPAAAARGRANFLKQGSALRTAVSRKQDARHKGWNNPILPVFPRKERTPVLNTLIAVVLAVVVFFGGTAATVHASQDSLPNQFLYPVKTLSEDALLSLTTSPQAEMDHILDFSDRRIAEMAGLVANGADIPATVVARLHTQLETALRLASGMDDPQLVQQLNEIRLRAEVQAQTMTALMANAPDSVQPVLQQVQSRIQEQIQLAAMGIDDPAEFRNRVQSRLQMQAGTGQPDDTPGAGSPGAGPQNGPGTGNGPQGTPAHDAQGTGTPSGYGPGGEPTGTPGKYGPGPQYSTTPQPGGSKRGP